MNLIPYFTLWALVNIKRKFQNYFLSLENKKKENKYFFNFECLGWVFSCPFGSWLLSHCCFFLCLISTRKVQSPLNTLYITSVSGRIGNCNWMVLSTSKLLRNHKRFHIMTQAWVSSWLSLCALLILKSSILKNSWLSLMSLFCLGPSLSSKFTCQL